MLTNIINQIQQERDQDRDISKRTGTNQIHDFTRIPGHRKVGPNIVLGRVSAFVQPPAPTREPVADPTPIAPIVPIEPVSESTHTTALIQPAKLSKAAMKKKQKEEELAKKREQQKAKSQAPAPAPAPEPAPVPAPEPAPEPEPEPEPAPAPEPAPIEIESTVSE